MDKPEWSDLPEELIDFTANRFSSNVEFLRIRSICKSWRSATSTKLQGLCLSNGFQRKLPSSKEEIGTLLSPTTFFRVTEPSSCSYKGWLIRTRQVSESSKTNLLSPLSRQLITPSRLRRTLDLLNFEVSEIRKSHEIHIYDDYFIGHLNGKKRRPSHMLSRIVFLDNIYFAIGHDEKIWYCKSGEDSRIWTKIKDQVEDFSDIILHRGQVYALHATGAIWWISLSQLSLVKLTPSTPMDYKGYKCCKDKRFLEYCGDLCIIHQLRQEEAGFERTVGFKVYKMEEDLAKWVEVSSLEDKAVIVVRDSCFTIVASEYHGCLKNSIYFIDNVGISGEEEVKLVKDGDVSSEYQGLLKNYIYLPNNNYSISYSYKFLKYEMIKGDTVRVIKLLDDGSINHMAVFKLDDDSIIHMANPSTQSCFEMFNPPFV